MMDKYSFVKQMFALGALNVLAICYDGQWLYAAVAADLLTLGYDLKALVN